MHVSKTTDRSMANVHLRVPRRGLLAWALRGGCCALCWGCLATVSSAQGPSWTSKLPWSKASKPAPQPNLSDYSRQQAQRNVVSPGMGLDNKPEPSRGAKMAAALSPSAMGKSVSSAFKKGGEKASNLFKKDPQPQSQAAASSWFRKDTLSADFYVSVARLQEQTGSFESAAEQYERALTIDPECLDALLGYARLYDRQQQLPQATTYYQRAVKAHPQDPTPYNDLGLCYARQRKYDEAAAALAKAIELKPDRDLYRNNLATLLVEMGRVDEAVAQLAAVYGEPVAHYNVGFLLQQRGSREAAREQFALAVAKNPNFDEARQWLAELSPGVQPRAEVARTPARAPADPAPAAGPVIAPARPATEPVATPAAGGRTAPPDRTEATPRPAASAIASAAVPPAVTAPAWSLVTDDVEGPATAPTPDQLRKQATVDVDPAAVRSAPSGVIRPLPAIRSGYVPPSRY